MGDWIEQALAELTTDEKVAMLAGRDLWSTVPVDRLGIPSLRFTDGPNGVRGFDGNHGTTSTSFPVGAAIGATWDPVLVAAVGRALARQAREKGASVLLGPTMNIPRVPNAGRNFECFSEEPVLSGVLAGAYVAGLQREGVAACIKHVVCNDQETDRFTVDVRVDDRTLHEVYLEPFRIAVAAAQPWAAMAAYNTINGIPASEHPLLDDVLRDQHGFDGLVMSDWYGTYTPGVVARGVDLEMPGPARWMAPEHVHAALADGSLTAAGLDRRVAALLRLVERTGGTHRAEPEPERAVERDEDRALVRRVATSATVLLRNDGILPLAPGTRVAVLGRFAADTPHQGGGSSSVRSHRVVSVLDGLGAAEGVDVVGHAPGCDTATKPPLLDPTRLSNAGGPGLEVTYVRGGDPDGPPARVATTTRTALEFFGPGDEWVEYDDLALRARGTWTPDRSGTHRLVVEAIGRVRLAVAGRELLDAWDEPASLTTVEVELEADVPVELDLAFASAESPFPWRAVRVGLEPEPAEHAIADAVALARDADVAVVVVGLGPEHETEGLDRADLRLPGDQDELVLTVGSPVELPWVEDVAAVVQAWYGGQEVGHAVADVLTGAADPGGRLPTVWPATSRQHPGLLNFPGAAGAVRYGEGVLVGQRAHEHLGLAPLFPFGHGGSYTTFEFHGPSVAAAGEAGDVAVTGVLANTGPRAGSEVVQVHVRDTAGIPARLVGFTRVELGPGETSEVTVDVPADRLRWWNPAVGGWQPLDRPLALEVRTTAGVQPVQLA
jgi:beta-glucosidase